MVKRRRRIDASVDGMPDGAPSAILGPLPGTSLTTLPIELSDDIARRAIQLGAGEALSLTCRAFSKTNLLHAPSLHIQLDSQGCDQFLTPRVVAALQARTCKLALTLEQQRAQSSREYIMLLTEILKKLDLSLQLQQLDLSSTTILQPEQPEPGEATLDNLFHASRLKQLSLLFNNMAEGDNKPLLPNLQPLSQHLTQLCLQRPEGVVWRFDKFTSALAPLAQLRVLTMPECDHMLGLLELLQALPQLHTLQLPDAAIRGQEQLDTLLAATQLTSIQLCSLTRLTSTRADAPCSWQRLELTGFVDCSTAVHLPLHTLTQPLVLGELRFNANDLDLVAAALHNLTQACKVSVRMKVLRLSARQHVELQQIMAVLQALKHCSWEKVFVIYMIVGAADVATLAPLCQGCTHLEYAYGSVTPSLEFWRQLLQLMPTVTHLIFRYSKGSDSAAMHQSLQLMAKQSWARWLDICIALPQLHILELPDAAIRRQERLAALLTATHLTSIQLKSVTWLTSTRANAPCSWQRLEFTGCVDCSFVAHLPLHTLTQPLVVGELRFVINDLDLVAAAVNNLTQTCKVPLGAVSVAHMNVGAADVSTLAPLCQACTQLEFAFGSVNPSLDF
ncbi:hypothetical protein V8C86DRAFT_3093218 [Haematococcus lacustris]